MEVYLLQSVSDTHLRDIKERIKRKKSQEVNEAGE